MKRPLALLVSSFAAAALAVGTTAQGAPGLLADVGPYPPLLDPPSHPVVRVQVGSGPFLMTADHPAVGIELWTTGPSSSALLADIRPGPADSSPADFTRVGNLVFFTADDGSHGRELWVTDGTPAGTTLVEDICPGGNGANPSWLAEYQGRLYFAADDGQSGRELWRSDGTAAGTSMFFSTAAGSASGTPHLLTVAGSTLFFAADSPAGRELWKTNGTPAGTVLVADIVPGGGSSQPLDLTAAGSLLFFTATTPASGRELWRSDGSAVGTFQLLEIVGGSGSPEPRDLTADGSILFFTAATSAIGRELWKADGSPGGTALVADLWPGPTGSNPGELTVDTTNSGVETYFAASHPTYGRELWRTNGTAAGTVLVTDVWPGTASSGPIGLALVVSGSTLRRTGEIWFAANDGTSGQELWRATGAAGGTTRVVDLRPGPASSSPDSIVALPASLLSTWVLFRADDGQHGNELWTISSRGGAPSVQNLAPAVGSSGARELVAIGRRACFVADDGVHGSELWITDGTAAGTSLVRDILPGTAGSEPQHLVAFDGCWWFSARDANAGRELWRSDGTALGTVMVADLEPGSASSEPSGLTGHGSQLWFSAWTSTAGRELHRSDGTAPGTALVFDVNPGSSSSWPAPLAGLGQRLMFRADDGTRGGELWQTDGTSTTLVLDIEPGAGGSDPDHAVLLGDSVLFAATVTGEGRELWASDGTAAGTARVADIAAGTGSSQPAELTLVEFTRGSPVVCFAASSTATGREVFVTDGTAAGTVLLRDLRPGPTGSGPRALTRVRRPSAPDLLMFAADDGTTGLELWRSSGSPQSTTLVADTAPGIRSSWPDEAGFVLALPGARQVLFAASDGLLGLEPWRHDLSAGTTVLHGDLSGGSFGSNPSLPVLAGSTLLFAADDGVHGREPWRMASMAALLPFGRGCAGGRGIVPSLDGLGSPVLGEPTFGLEIAGAPPAGSAFVLFGVAPGTLAFGPCSLLVQPLVALGVTADGSGTAVLGLGLPADPALLGARLLAQGLVVDAPAPIAGALCATHGIEILIGPN